MTLCSKFFYYTGQALSFGGEKGVGIENYSLSPPP